MQKISLLLLTKDCSSDLKKYYSWVKSADLIDEVICVDDLSQDNTTIVAKNLFGAKAKIHKRKLDDFASQRNFAISKCKNNWILWLDPDEELNKDNLPKLTQLNLSTSHIYHLKRSEIFLGKHLKYGEVGDIYKARLFNKQHSCFFGQVHEDLKTSASIQKTNIEIFHHGNTSVNIFFSKINLYSSFRARELFDQKEKHSLFKLVFYPLAKFIQNYFWQLGFIDGIQGCIFAFGMSFHSFLVRAKLWHLHQSH